MASPCWYTLVLRYGTNKFFLAPRASIIIDEGNDMEALQDLSCASCGTQADRTWKIKAYFVGGCDMASAWTLFNQLQAFLSAACDSDLTIERTVCAETPLVFLVKKITPRMTDVNLQRMAIPRLLSMEITIELTRWVQAGDGAVLVGA